MQTTASLPPLVALCLDHHTAAATYHEEAAEAHRQAISHYMYGDFQQANEYARQAKNNGEHAMNQCLMALE